MTSCEYDVIGVGYASQRRPDPRIAAAIDSALGDAVDVLNVGAGAGSYEPDTRSVIALDPSATMLAQRPAGSAPFVQGRAEYLPFDDGTFDALLGVLTLHHWWDKLEGIRECVRVARKRVVLLTWDPEGPGFWLTNDYLPEFNELDRHQFPSVTFLEDAFGSRTRVETRVVPVPKDCIDGFLGAYWARPEQYLDPAVQRGISSFARCDTSHGLDRLDKDLSSGIWRERYGNLLSKEELDVGYRLLVASL